MLKHLDWVEKQCRVVLSEVNLSIEDYIDTMSTPGVPLDFTAIVVLARIYHIHITVYTNARIWSTSSSHPYKDAHFGLIFNRGFNFTETVSCGNADAYRDWIETRAQEGRLPSHTRNCLPDEIKVEAKLSTVSQALDIVHNMVMCKHGNPSDCVTCEDNVQSVKCENTLGSPNWENANCDTSLDSDISPLKVFLEDQNNNTSQFFSEDQNNNASEFFSEDHNNNASEFFSEDHNNNTLQFLAAVKNENPGDAQSTMEYSEGSEEDSDDNAHDVGGQVERQSSDDYDLLCHEKLNISLSSNQDNAADSKINLLWHAAQSTLMETKKE